MTSNKNENGKSPTAEELVGDLPQRVADAEERGYFGTVPDPTPNEAYTLGGVTQGQATPETDEQAAADAEQHSQEVADNLDNPGENNS